MNKRIKWIDVAKGICMISVIMGHLGVENINYVVYAYHLSLFFILSGYTMKQTVVNKDYLNKRFKSLMLPYFVTCICVMIMDIFNCFFLWHNISNENITNVIAKDIIRSFWASGSVTNFGNVEIGTRIGAIWFLPALFFSSVFVQVVINYIKDKRIQYGIVATCALAGMISARFIWLPFSIQSALMAMPYVLLGYEIKQNNLLEKLNLRVAIFCFLIFLIGIQARVSLISFVSADAPDYLLSFIVAVASSACIIYVSRKLEECRPLELVGRYSLYFMCIHLLELETMGMWMYKALDHLGIYNTFTSFCAQVISICFITFLIVMGKKFGDKVKKQRSVKTSESTRNVEMDAAKGMLIILMVIGHFVVDASFRKILYSFHMAAFILYSGFYFKETACDNMKKSIIRLMKSFLIPYGCFAVIYCLITHDGIGIELKNVICGLSFSNRFFNECSSIGPVYFVLLLFLVRLMYMIIEKFTRGNWSKHFIVLGLSLIGNFLGAKGYWLPWSADVAMYSLVFYHIGYCLKKYNIMEYICNRNYLYFILSSIWAYMIYQGGMEIAVRYYGNYSLVVVGAVCGSVLFYMFFREVSKMCKGIVKPLELVGKGTIYVLIIHTLFNGYIYKWVMRIWQEGYFIHLMMTVIIQIFAGLIVAIVVKQILLKGRQLKEIKR